MKKNTWYTALVIEGEKLGRTIGFPTINLDNPAVLTGKKEGVYAALVNIEGKIHTGALYYGPRHVLGETHTVLEIYILDFNQEMYGLTVSFTLVSFIRPPKKISGMQALKKQLEQDIDQVKQTFQ